MVVDVGTAGAPRARVAQNRQSPLGLAVLHEQPAVGIEHLGGTGHQLVGHLGVAERPRVLLFAIEQGQVVEDFGIDAAGAD